MSDRMDQFFKDKLADHSLPPSPNAWARVKETLPKKNNTRWILRIAAAIVLIGALITSIVWNSMQESLSTPPQITKQEPTPIEKITVPEKKDNENPVVTPSSKIQTASVNKDQKISPIHHKKDQAINKEPGENKIQEEQVVVALPIQNAVVEKVAANSEKPIVLEYRLPSLSQVQSNPLSTELASEPKEKSGFRKVLEFAREAKQGEGPLNLRQAKEDFFALNFKKDKQKNQK